MGAERGEDEGDGVAVIQRGSLRGGGAVGDGGEESEARCGESRVVGRGALQLGEQTRGEGWTGKVLPHDAAVAFGHGMQRRNGGMDIFRRAHVLQGAHDGLDGGGGDHMRARAGVAIAQRRASRVPHGHVPRLRFHFTGHDARWVGGADLRRRRGQIRMTRRHA